LVKLLTIGVLALQGAFDEHLAILRRLGAEASAVRLPNQLDRLDGLVVPGGESTTIGKLLVQYDLLLKLKKMVEAGFPLFGTCAGLILLAKEILGDSSQPLIGVMDMTVKRNYFGRQVDSFEADLAVPELGDSPFHAVFIRAPVVKWVGSEVQVLARLPTSEIVAVRQDNLLACAFHPELGEDPRFHQYFLGLVGEYTKKTQMGENLRGNVYSSGPSN